MENKENAVNNRQTNTTPDAAHYLSNDVEYVRWAAENTTSLAEKCFWDKKNDFSTRTTIFETKNDISSPEEAFPDQEIPKNWFLY